MVNATARQNSSDGFARRNSRADLVAGRAITEMRGGAWQAITRGSVTHGGGGNAQRGCRNPACRLLRHQGQRQWSKLRGYICVSQPFRAFLARNPMMYKENDDKRAGIGSLPFCQLAFPLVITYDARARRRDLPSFRVSRDKNHRNPGSCGQIYGTAHEIAYTSYALRPQA